MGIVVPVMVLWVIGIGWLLESGYDEDLMWRKKLKTRGTYNHDGRGADHLNWRNPVVTVMVASSMTVSAATTIGGYVHYTARLSVAACHRDAIGAIS